MTDRPTYIDLFGLAPSSGHTPTAPARSNHLVQRPEPVTGADLADMLRESLAARSAAIARVDNNADTEWKQRAAEVIERVCSEREYFTADDLWDFLDQPRTPSAVGPALLRAAREGLCEPTDVYQPTRFKQRHHDVRVWHSLVD